MNGTSGGGAAPVQRPLTARQREVYDFCAAFVARHDAFPTIREIMEAFGLRGPNGVAGHLRYLEQKGWLWRDPAHAGRSRMWRLCGPLAQAEPPPKPSRLGRQMGRAGVRRAGVGGVLVRVPRRALDAAEARELAALILRALGDEDEAAAPTATSSHLEGG